ncbi:MAG: right-handed parallel beta-helix repeat-containing protein [Akkermansiaceae bacterium]|jgi:tetratricopeptide (TPR) repeat protein|nr:right-handed parallel beta-helix repeat-containing protein [Akkermansiaceae bacterium]
MTLKEARQILGLGPDEDPQPHLREFLIVRERLAEMVRSAPTAELAGRYQLALTDMDRSLAALRDHLAAPAPAVPDAESPADPPAPAVRRGADAWPMFAWCAAKTMAAEPDSRPTAKSEDSPVARQLSDPEHQPESGQASPETQDDPVWLERSRDRGAQDAGEEKPNLTTADARDQESGTEPGQEESGDPPAEQPEPGPDRHRGRLSGGLVVACLLVVALAGGAWYYLKQLADERYERQLRIARLESEGAAHVRERRWEEAKQAFAAIERIDPASPVVPMGRRAIEAGMTEEQEMFVNYWTGQARAALDSARFDEAEEAARKVLAELPHHAECRELLRETAAARISADRAALLDQAKDHLAKREWESALAAARAVMERHPGDREAAVVVQEAESAIQQVAADRARARELHQQAVAKDTGEYDPEVFEWLREASALAPDDGEIAKLFEEVSTRSRSLRVPEAFPTPQEALASAREGDRVILGEGVWKGPLEVNIPVEILGAGAGKTVIACQGAEGCVITLGPGANGSRVSRVTFRHDSLTGGDERYSAALVRGAAVEWTDCEFLDGCGHGLALIERAQGTVARCRFAGNGWNGAAAMGPGVKLDIRDSSLTGNCNHGIEVWNDAALTAVGNRCEANTGNGIHIDSGEAPAIVNDNRLTANREFGMVVTSAGAIGQIRQNTATGNLLGGLAVRSMALCPVTHNKLERNQGPGLTLEDGLNPIAYTDNIATGNTGKDRLTGLKFAREAAPEAADNTAAR